MAPGWGQYCQREERRRYEFKPPLDLSVGQAIVLGFFQGLTEFLPVSSSGHLVLLGQLFGLREPDLTFSVMVHFGTLIAVMIALRAEVALMLGVPYRRLLWDYWRKTLLKGCLALLPL